jgi:hypothetical protein
MKGVAKSTNMWLHRYLLLLFMITQTSCTQLTKQGGESVQQNRFEGQGRHQFSYVLCDVM